jgi:spore photoproduct lyase
MFHPARAYVEERALAYPLAAALLERLRTEGVPVETVRSHSRLPAPPGDTPRAQYAEAKRTLAIGVRQTLAFATSRPSADYALPLVTGCPGHCTYCYLQSTLGARPAVRVYVNLEEIFAQAARYMAERAPANTTFEGSCTSDPVAVEPYTHALAEAVRFFAASETGRFRFVTKYDDVEGLLGIEHRGHTQVRFSLNSREAIRDWEHAVPGVEARLAAAARVRGAGYPLGFIIAPVFVRPGWQEEYERLVARVEELFGDDPDITFEIITHRYTLKAKRLILARYPDSGLPMDESRRRFKYGQFGYGKYLYPADAVRRVDHFFRERLARRWAPERVLYVI